MKKFRGKSDIGDVIERASRWIAIQFRSDGSTFFRWHGHRENLADYLAANNPWCGLSVTEFVNGAELIRIAGYYADSAFTGRLIELDDTGERVRVYLSGYPTD